jgi:ABC-type sugar transport system permease subunit
MFDSGFHKTLLFLPAFGVVVFTVIPLVYMILIAFTNYDKDHQVPANLFTWIGFDNFRTMLGSGSVLAETFWGILGWTVVWAVFATFLNYILGIVLALLINKKGIKFKGFFRTLFVLAIVNVIAAAAMLCSDVIAGGFAVLGAISALIYCRLSAYKNFGGITGDTAGWFLQVCELTIAIMVLVGEKITEAALL